MYPYPPSSLAITKRLLSFRWLFWTDWGLRPRIERSGMDGSHRSAIVTSSVHWPNGVTVDMVMDRLYWVDAKLNLIASADLDGANTRVVLYSTELLRHPFSVTLFEDWVYWTDWDKNAIFRADKFNGSKAQPVSNMHMVNNRTSVTRNHEIMIRLHYFIQHVIFNTETALRLYYGRYFYKNSLKRN